MLRPDLVASGVSFLRHSKVQNEPLSRRLAFLEEKGLTSSEVSEALRLVENAGSANASERPSSLNRVSSVGAENGGGIAVTIAAAAAAGFVLRGLAEPDETEGSVSRPAPTVKMKEEQAEGRLWAALRAKFSSPEAGPTMPEVVVPFLRFFRVL